MPASPAAPHTVSMEQRYHGLLVPVLRGHMQRGLVVSALFIDARAMRKKIGHNRCLALPRGVVQRCVAWSADVRRRRPRSGDTSSRAAATVHSRRAAHGPLASTACTFASYSSRISTTYSSALSTDQCSGVAPVSSVTFTLRFFLPPAPERIGSSWRSAAAPSRHATKTASSFPMAVGRTRGALSRRSAARRRTPPGSGTRGRADGTRACACACASRTGRPTSEARAAGPDGAA